MIVQAQHGELFPTVYKDLIVISDVARALQVNGHDERPKWSVVMTIRMPWTSSQCLSALKNNKNHLMLRS